jgi:hypothetical protein
LVSQLCGEMIKKQHLLNFRQRIDMLYGLTCLYARDSSVSPNVKALMETLLDEINIIEYQVIVDDLFHAEISPLYEVYTNLTTS